MKVQISIQKRRYKGKITGYTVVPCQIVNGVRKRIGCKTFKTEAEAKEYKKALALSIGSGKQALPNTMTVKEMAEKWLESKKADIKETTYESYRTKVYKYIIPMMGDKKVQEIRKPFLKKYLASLVLEYGFSESSIGHHRTILQGIFEEAVDNDIITVNPAVGLKIPKQAKKPRSMELYSIDLLLEFLEKIKPFKMATMIILCLYHGLRRGEACGLRWSDIDWGKGIIYVRNQRTTVKGKVVEGPLKTANSERKLYLTDRSTAILRAELERQERNKKLLGSAYHDTGYVLVNDNGLPYNPNSRSNEMAKILKKLDFPPLVLHGLRDTFARINYDSGMNILELMRAMGHSEMRTTYSYIEKLKEANYVSSSNVDKVISEAASAVNKESEHISSGTIDYTYRKSKFIVMDFPSKFVRRASNN